MIYWCIQIIEKIDHFLLIHATIFELENEDHLMVKMDLKLPNLQLKSQSKPLTRALKYTYYYDEDNSDQQKTMT